MHSRLERLLYSWLHNVLGIAVVSTADATIFAPFLEDSGNFVGSFAFMF
jgi:hypothetical protein